MNVLPSLATWQFALAGLVCAGLALIIHIFNRRRQRVVQWAAMELLQQALRRKRRMIRLRDLLLLLLRIAAVLFFGLALAQPYWSSRGQPLDASQPVHLVLLIDNSLSMAYETLEGTLLDRAKQRSRRLIQSLPRGSQVCLVPVCGSRFDDLVEPVRSKERALELLDRVEVVDRAASIRQVAQAARRGSQSAGELTPRVMLLTDRQRVTWADLKDGMADTSSLLQVVDVSAEKMENCWVADVQVQDGIADTQTPATILVRIKNRGTRSRDIQITLSVDQQIVATQPVTLNAVDEQEVTFVYTFRAPNSENMLGFVPVKVAVTSDLLPLDDERYLMVPVVANLPAVFVDQYGDREEPLAGKVGETRSLRRLLAPMTGAMERANHRRIDQLTQSVLADARLVVIAGIPTPGDRVALLRQFVEQGGQLVIAAGGDFDPRAWTSAGWIGGRGILPAPLESAPVGEVPEVAQRLEPFAISFPSIAGHSYFQIAEVSETERRALYAQALFFKAVQLDLAAAAKPSPESQRKGPPMTNEINGESRWLRWARPVTTEEQHSDESPRVLARFSNSRETPFLVEQRVGRGRILFVSSGVQSNWNTIPRTNAILLFDRILREMLHETLPARNFTTQERIAVPLSVDGQAQEITLTRPGSVRSVETLDHGFIRHNLRGVAIERPFRRGVYQLTVVRDPQVASSANIDSMTELAVNGSQAESDLAAIGQPELAQLAANEQLRWVGREEEINLAGVHVRGQDSWWWIVLLTFLMLIAECVILAATTR